MFNLNLEERNELLKYARFCLEEEMDVITEGFMVSPDFIENYSEKYGVFVSLYNKNELRGCLGQISSYLPLYKTIRQMTKAVATHDHRFKPVTAKEVPKLMIEISILSPLKKIKDVSDIELGRHGIYIEKGGLTGTFLPQVAENYDWSLEEFLGHCSESKAGIGWDGWKNASIFIYETIVFKE